MNLDSEPMGIAASLRLDAISFQDGEGRVWTVFEWPAMPGCGLPPTLVFETALVVRRVRSYPANWRELEREGLERASWER